MTDQATDRRERAAEFGRELREGPEPSDRSIKEIIDALRPQLQELANKQLELARTELVPVGRQAGIATGLLVVGAVFVHLFLVFFSVFGIYLLNEVAGLSLWLSALIVSGILLLIGGILAGAGASVLRRLDPKPHRTIRTFQQNLEWLKGQFRS
ncbi:MAG: phage holin family protein [Actinobacteria bacterium]|nr:phage holin family protein [Actinomycetota bacterium]